MADDRREAIIEAAFRVFSRHGFKGATNKAIAEEAGVTPGLIYWYFENKEDLFLNVIRSKSMLMPLSHLTEEMLAAPPRAFFTRVAETFAAFFRDQELQMAVRLLLSEALMSEQVRKVLIDDVIAQGIEIISRYIEYQIARGKIRPVDPHLGARLFVGTLFSQAMFSQLLGVPSRVSDDEVAKAAVDVFIQGVLDSNDDEGKERDHA